MRILLVDNHDSYTFNLYQQMARIGGHCPVVATHDGIDLQAIRDLDPACIVISPGPGRPDRPRDFGICAQVLRELSVPLLGVCLGHQGLAQAFGAAVAPAPEVVHGRIFEIYHDSSALFEGMPQAFPAVRYHSLAVSPDLPECLQRIAWTGDGVVMGIRHRELPFWGVQFHPESIGTPDGDRLIQNFLRLCEQHLPRRASVLTRARPPAQPDASRRPTATSQAASVFDAGLSVHFKKLDFYVDPEDAFARLYGGSEHAFWLDSSLVDPDRARFAFMGAADGPNSAIVAYRVEDRRLTVEKSGTIYHFTESILDFLDRELKRLACPAPGLPFAFNGGFVGYFGYELKAECGGKNAHRSKLPDAHFVFADRFVAFDLLDRTVYLVALHAGPDGADRDPWFASVEAALRHATPAPPIEVGMHRPPAGFTLARDRERYVADIYQCLQEIREGESYEVCLTNQIRSAPLRRPFDVYRMLRRNNPAPFAAYLRFGRTAILSSSPEQFLRIDPDRWVTSMPIKGTAPRHHDPGADDKERDLLALSTKNRAENLMIVDLVRNDLGRVCDIGSVTVPHLMRVESFATVHHLTSTIRGRLREDASAVDAVRAAFPGGSMTGAPKVRTMEIIDRVEEGSRGVYSGSIGYLGLDGSAVLSIVIRTAVATPDETSIGTGGAIVALSDPEQEVEEMWLKAQALIRAIRQVETGECDRPGHRSALPIR